ncbi:MAG TPA: acyl-CoA dehydrogenase family protein, partial [Acidimicrobiales bacterium]
MDLELSDDEAALRENVRSVLSGICPPSTVRAVHEGTGDGSGVWARMVDLSWPALAIPEAHGGLGMGFVEVAIVVEELGRSVAPGPFLATVTQFAPAVREVGDLGGTNGGTNGGAGDADGPGPAPFAADLLRRLAAGELTGAVAQAEGADWGPAAGSVTATPGSGGSWVLHGTKGPVLDGATADEVLVVAAGANGASGLGAFVVPGAALATTARPVIDPTLPLADVGLDGVVVPADRVLAAPGTPGVAEALARAGHEATVALATATVGTCRAIFEQTVAYTKVREQYGRPIGSFQALKHRMADLLL